MRREENNWTELLDFFFFFFFFFLGGGGGGCKSFPYRADTLSEGPNNFTLSESVPIPFNKDLTTT